MTTRMDLSGVSAQKNLGHVFLEVKYFRNLLEKNGVPFGPGEELEAKTAKIF